MAPAQRGYVGELACSRPDGLLGRLSSAHLLQNASRVVAADLVQRPDACLSSRGHAQSPHRYHEPRIMSAATLVVERAKHYFSLASTDLATGYLTLPRKQVPPPEESL